MNKKQTPKQFKISPEHVHTWTLALYPAAILGGGAYLIITHTEVTTELAGLLIGLLTAGSLKAAISSSDKKENGDADNNRGADGDIRRSSSPKLEQDDRGRSDDTNSRFDILAKLHWPKIHRVYG